MLGGEGIVGSWYRSGEKIVDSSWQVLTHPFLVGNVGSFNAVLVPSVRDSLSCSHIFFWSEIVVVPFGSCVDLVYPNMTLVIHLNWLPY
jgi:hypothetical protein